MGTDVAPPDTAPAAPPDTAPAENPDTSSAAEPATSTSAIDDERSIRARLRWRCRRGTRELDTLLVRFFDENYLSLSAADKQRFSQLLELPDPDLHDYLMGWYEAADPAMADLLARVRSL